MPVEEGEEVPPPAAEEGVPPPPPCPILDKVTLADINGVPLTVPPHDPLPPSCVTEGPRLPLEIPLGDTERSEVKDALAEVVNEGEAVPDPLPVAFPVPLITTEAVGENVCTPLPLPKFDGVPPPPVLPVAPLVIEGEPEAL